MDLKSIINGIKNFMQQKELNNQTDKKKVILSDSVVKKNSKVDTEKILYDELFQNTEKDLQIIERNMKTI